MRYLAYTAQTDLIWPLRAAVAGWLALPAVRPNGAAGSSGSSAPGGQSGPLNAWLSLQRQMRAAASVFDVLRVSHARPMFELGTIATPEGPMQVRERVALALPFGSLLHFQRLPRGGEGDDSPSADSRRSAAAPLPRVLIVAPMSGHFATLLRDTVRTMLADHEVYITDWHNARDVPLWQGRFGFDEVVATLIDFIAHVGGDPHGGGDMPRAGGRRDAGAGTSATSASGASQIEPRRAHVVAVCQPCVAVLAAAALMAEDHHPAQPCSLTLMAGPVDCRVNPTRVNHLAMSKPMHWFDSQLVDWVPPRYAGVGRRVYPGFMQLSAFMAMNLERHVHALRDMFTQLASDDAAAHAKADVTRAFYEEYFAVADLPAEFYLETVSKVFQEFELARGILQWRGRPVVPAAITRTALLTVEGEKDDICAIGQTLAAQDLCSGIRPYLKQHHLQAGVGHYGVFSGKRWQQMIYPQVRDMIQVMDARQ